jgi:hypothetical protein
VKRKQRTNLLTSLTRKPYISHPCLRRLGRAVAARFCILGGESAEALFLDRGVQYFANQIDTDELPPLSCTEEPWRLSITRLPRM